MTNTLDLLSNKFDVTDSGCWEWTAFRKPNGYGQFGRNGYAHRVVYETVVGPIPDGLVIDHLCRNRCCVNPDHLEAVTIRTNLLRGEGFVAHKARQTHCKRGHLLSGKNLIPDKQGRRQCRACHSARGEKA